MTAHISAGSRRVSEGVSGQFQQVRKATGFAYLRLGLAVAIVSFHAVTITNGSAAAIPISVMAMARIILPTFFAMSGFLVTASLLRAQSTSEFLTLRAVRLLPALAIVVLISAVVIGPALTGVSMPNYFLSRDFGAYFSNMIAIPHYTLPGVFVNNPRAGVVNGSLWTIQAEIACYFLLMAVGACGLTHRPKALGVVLGMLAIAVSILLRTSASHYVALLPAPELMVFFFAGAALSATGDHIAIRPALAAACLILSIILVPNPNWSCLGAFPLAFGTVWIAQRGARLSFPMGDYSYGLYLIGYPLEQTFVQIFPKMHSPWITISCVLPVALIGAIGLWHFIEAPILKRRISILGALQVNRHRVATWVWKKTLDFGQIPTLGPVSRTTDTLTAPIR